jgi:hypothetical protein
MIKNKYSVLSVDSNPDYLFFVPMTCAFWKEIGYQPYVILVDTGIEPELKKLVFAETEKAGGYIKVIEHIEGYRTCNVAQISRLYAAADPFFKDDDYLMTDDMDKFVIDYMWFNQQNGKKDIHIYDPDELNYKRLKIGNIGMKANVWKEVIGIENGSIRQNLIKCFEKNLSKESDWNTGWNLDEWILTKSVFASRFYPDQCQNFVRGGNRWGVRNGRICRGAWAPTFDLCMNTKIIDVHLHRDPYVGQVWEDTITIMRRVFPENKVQEFINYKEEFVRLISG